jgi:hypothetical protein
VEFGDVVFLPGPVRVTPDRSRLGQPVDPSALQVTGVDSVVTVKANEVSLVWAVEGAETIVTFPDGSEVRAEVVSVSQAAPGEGDGTLVVTLRPRKEIENPGSGSVTVSYVDAEASDVLAVPVIALVALAEGGYGVQLEDGTYVAVEPGLYANGLVEIDGDLEPGTKVRVPA